MKKVTGLSLLLPALFCAAACAAPISLNDEEVAALTAPIFEGVKEAYNEANYDKMAIYFGELMFLNFPQTAFMATRDEIFELYGSLDSAEYMGFLTQLDATVVLYKGRFAKSEGLVKLVLSKEKEGITIIGLWFE